MSIYRVQTKVEKLSKPPELPYTSKSLHKGLSRVESLALQKCFQAPPSHQPPTNNYQPCSIVLSLLLGQASVTHKAGTIAQADRISPSRGSHAPGSSGRFPWRKIESDGGARSLCTRPQASLLTNSWTKVWYQHPQLVSLSPHAVPFRC